jgi:hypothetical protein
MTVDESCYGDALRTLARGRMVVCVPGRLDGGPCVSTVSYRQPTKADERAYMLDPDPEVRAGFLLGVTFQARGVARADGVQV